MHIHILGICGTFMGGLALIAKQLGHEVSGSDQNVYPPMSTQLEELGIKLHEGYDAQILEKEDPDLIVVGNAMSRGNPAVEYVLNHSLPYMSGPQWLEDYLLKDRWVLAVAGTHGKTSTASMLAWILEYANMEPGFLIGGIPENFGISARCTDSGFFVVEADEYDTAFFDKRSKFVHYLHKSLIMNNLEFDHADIFPDLEAIKTQFHHLVRIVPGNGLVIMPDDSPELDEVVEMGCWTPIETLGQSNWKSKPIKKDYSKFEVIFNDGSKDKHFGELSWDLIGFHNMMNALASLAAARNVGVPVTVAIEALQKFKSVKRRMELRGCIGKISVYDDFAHHPTAIAASVLALRNKVGDERIISVTDMRSNTMKLGIHKKTMLPALEKADINLIHKPLAAEWEFDNFALQHMKVYAETDDLLDDLLSHVKPKDHVLIMSNGSFDGIYEKLLEALQEKYN
ncbi:MAG: UDP-N-acetylmuramate:L-alanyl-gamma-D-glutamyl-meso-diaminopimelate ligase [Gammaproteobacteria bacterium]|nr:UDP-N-acetylmuramate:L-alanyl-gamma-D-glutamyl-meso-diaminopimelate ligase [Gammaproteobacteria bacterium]